MIEITRELNIAQIAFGIAVIAFMLTLVVLGGGKSDKSDHQKTESSKRR